MSQLRLLKLVVQPIFVLDDGEGLTEVNVQPSTVAGKDWPEWATTGYAEDFEALRTELEGDEK